VCAHIITHVTLDVFCDVFGSLIGHDSLRLSSLELPQGACVPRQPTRCSEVASETEALAEEITGEMCDTAHNFVIHLHWVCEVLASHYWTCVHMKTTCRQTMWHVVWHSWQLCDRFTSSLPGLRISLLNMCSHEDHMHRNSQWEWAFIHISYASVP
jgi:hypothetical protein